MHAIAGGSGRPKSTTRSVGLVAVALLFSVVSVATTPAGVQAASGRYLDPVFNVRRDANIQYGTATMPDGTRQALRLDLYRPAGDTARNRPAVIYVHGGDHTSYKHLWRNRIAGEMFAKRGFVAAVIAYRSGIGGMDRAAAWDLRAAIRWVRKNSGWLNTSPNRIIVGGGSSGATTILNATFDPSDVGTSGNPGYSSAVNAGFSISGMASDYTKITPGDPPIAMIIAHDDPAFFAGTLATCHTTRAQGNICDLYEYPSGGHPPPFWVAYREQIVEQVSQFVCRRLLGPVVCRDANGDGKVD